MGSEMCIRDSFILGAHRGLRRRLVYKIHLCTAIITTPTIMVIAMTIHMDMATITDRKHTRSRKTDRLSPTTRTQDRQDDIESRRILC